LVEWTWLSSFFVVIICVLGLFDFYRRVFEQFFDFFGFLVLLQSNISLSSLE